MEGKRVIVDKARTTITIPVTVRLSVHRCDGLWCFRIGASHKQFLDIKEYPESDYIYPTAKEAINAGMTEFNKIKKMLNQN